MNTINKNKRNNIQTFSLLQKKEQCRRVQTETYDDSDCQTSKNFNNSKIDKESLVHPQGQRVNTQIAEPHNLDYQMILMRKMQELSHHNKVNERKSNHCKSPLNILQPNSDKLVKQKIDKIQQKHNARVTSTYQQQNTTTNISKISVQPQYSQMTFVNEKQIGNGSFGTVFKATVLETGEIVAIKKVVQDKRYKNREFEILKELNHPNCLKLKHAFFSAEGQEQYLHVVTDYYPDTIYSYNKFFTKNKKVIPEFQVKIYAYQLIRSLHYIHQIGICHRDIKPQNLLINPQTNKLVLCDFGSAKKLVKNEPNIAYICSRAYRAPELIFGSTDYTEKIDIWSTACVIAEMATGEPLFFGESSVDQLIEIIKIIGIPHQEDLIQMNHKLHLSDYQFPPIKARDWKKVLNLEESLLELLSQMLVWNPKKRLSGIECLASKYFDSLRCQTSLQSFVKQGGILPNLYDFSPEELNTSSEAVQLLIPEWYLQQLDRLQQQMVQQQ